MGEQMLGYDVEKQWDYENGFYLTSHVTRLGKLLAHFELYKSITGLPGHIVECGVYKGASLVRFASFRQLLESPHSRKIVGFDTFGKFPRGEGIDESDSAFIDRFEQDGAAITPEALHKVLAHKSFENVELIAGDILETVPAYAQANPEFRIALLHIDVDVYEPSLVTLRHFYDRVVPGGLIVLDDYGTVSGETTAVEEFFADKSPHLEKLSISHVPAFIRK